LEKPYNLRNVRTVFGLESNGVSARFEFDLFIDRIVFEQYVESWWAGARKYLRDCEGFGIEKAAPADGLGR
jgi:hypothetical protein